MKTQVNKSHFIPPRCRWFLAAYVREVWSRLPALLAASTSIYGSILKIHGTKKICKKLQGAAVNTASWATNVGNERGEVLISILTASEGVEALQPLATGLMRRYQLARIDPPILLYTDRDCCSESGQSKYQVLPGISSADIYAYVNYPCRFCFPSGMGYKFGWTFGTL